MKLHTKTAITLILGFGLLTIGNANASVSQSKSVDTWSQYQTHCLTGLDSEDLIGCTDIGVIDNIDTMTRLTIGNMTNSKRTETIRKLRHFTNIYASH